MPLSPVPSPLVARLRRSLLVPVALAALVGLPQPVRAAQAPTPAPRVAAAVPASQVIAVDGVLDEESWARARPIGPFVQQEPLEGQPPSEATEVRVLFTPDALYFGIHCYDRSPGAIVSTVLTRDASLDVDDMVSIVIDPFLDHRNGFFFEVNPAGARADGQVSNNAEHLSRDWDGIWSAAARITADGWTAEIGHPVQDPALRARVRASGDSTSSGGSSG